MRTVSSMPNRTPARSGRRPARIARVGYTAALALALACSGGAAPVAGAASAPQSSPIVAMRHALAAATSYQVGIKLALSDEQPLRYTIVAVRSGRVLRLYLRYDLSGMYGTGAPDSTGEEVIAGSRICERAKPNGRFTCKTSPKDAKEEGAFESNSFLANFPVAVTPIGSKRIGGQSCDGYRVAPRTKTAYGTGYIYIAPATRLPCSLTMTSTSNDNGDKQTSTIDMTWSRFNDRTLTVPRVP